MDEYVQRTLILTGCGGAAADAAIRNYFEGRFGFSLFEILVAVVLSIIVTKRASTLKSSPTPSADTR